LGMVSEDRQVTYRELFRHHLSDADIYKIRQATHYCHPLGNDRFKEKIESMLERKVGYAGHGRPCVRHGSG